MATVWRTNPDGTTLYAKVGNESLQVAEPARVGRFQGKYIDDLTAMQVGLWYILDQVKVTSVNRAKMMLRGLAEEAEFRFGEIALDHPDTEDSMAPNAPIVTIMATGETDLQLAGPLSEQPLLEDTINLYKPDTVLQKLYEAAVTLEIVCWFTNKDDRAGARKAVISALSREPLDNRPGRRVVIRPYYDRVAIYDLQGVTYVDDPESAQAKRFPVIFRVASSIEVVELVDLPEYFKPVVHIENAVGTLDGDCSPMSVL